jgi:hypothetical protein
LAPTGIILQLLGPNRSPLHKPVGEVAVLAFNFADINTDHTDPVAKIENASNVSGPAGRDFVGRTYEPKN